jgi:hypothetical protein
MNTKRGVWFLMIISLIIIGCQPEEQIETIEESTGSGTLKVETFPGEAEIFIDNTYSGKSPTTLYNIPIGSQDIVIKKERYEDFTTVVEIVAGKKTFLEANLVLITGLEEIPEIIEVVEEESDGMEEEKEEKSLKVGNMVNIGSGLLLYYDFSEEEFINIKQPESDIFSKRFDSYLVFTRYPPTKIKTISKSIDDIEKGDCAGIVGQFEYLHSGKSLCVITKENEIMAVGGEWEETENLELTWKLFG